MGMSVEGELSHPSMSRRTQKVRAGSAAIEKSCPAAVAVPEPPLSRISLVLGIYKALHILYPQPELADQWIKLRNANPLLGGDKPPLELMIDGGIDGLHRVRRLLDARRGAWN